MRNLPKLNLEVYFKALVRGIYKGITSFVEETINYGEFDPGSE